MKKQHKRSWLSLGLNGSILAVCFVLIKLKIGGLVPALLVPLCFMAMVFNSVYYFYWYEEGVSLEDAAKQNLRDVTKASADGFESFKSRDK